MIHFRMAKNTSRRNFLRTAPVAAAASFALTDALLLAAQTPVASSDSAAAPFQLFTAQQLADDTKALAAKGGNNNLVDVKPNLPFSMVLTTEIAKSAPNFEQHAERDHIFIILDGSTVYEIGGTLKNAHTTKPGEQLAPDAVGTTKVTLNKGDILTVPRGTPHRRTTAGSVTLILISPSGTMKA